jgi:hypothetical protein
MSRPAVALLICALVTLPSQALPKRRAVSPVPPQCPAMTSDNMVINYRSSVSNCNSVAASPCTIGEPVDFSVLSRGYDFQCDAHTVTWNFSDGNPSETIYPSGHLTRVFPTSGTFIVTAVVKSRTQQIVLGVPLLVQSPQ